MYRIQWINLFLNDIIWYTIIFDVITLNRFIIDFNKNFNNTSPTHSQMTLLQITIKKILLNKKHLYFKVFKNSCLYLLHANY